MTRVLVVGSGAREHALAWAFARSSTVDDIVVAPGNPGCEAVAECAPLAADDPAAVAALAKQVDADLVVVGPEEPLVRGAADAVRADGRLCFGPSAGAARLEGSKRWLKEVLAAAGVPTAASRAFSAAEEGAALAHLDTMRGGYVIKTDGLAAGKGVVVTESLAEARDAVRSYLSGDAFGAAGTTCVIEEMLRGPELSLLVLCDGTQAWPLVPAQDHKRVGDGDTGPNTGGMGAYAPVPFAGEELVERVMRECVTPTLRELDGRGTRYQGVLFTQFMVTAEGPKLVEYNVRFGDPECEAVVPLLRSDLYAHCAEAAAGALRTPLVFSDESCVTVVLAAPGYPTATRTGDAIDGVAAAGAVDGVVVFHAGTRRDGDTLRTAGGRVLAVSAVGPDLAAARARAYAAAAEVRFEGVHYRRDIAHQGLS